VTPRNKTFSMPLAEAYSIAKTITKLHVKARAPLHVAPEPRQCATCGVAFTPQRSDARTCGPACRQALYRKRLTA
jgi:hypothetical protein